MIACGLDVTEDQHDTEPLSCRTNTSLRSNTCTASPIGGVQGDRRGLFSICGGNRRPAVFDTPKRRRLYCPRIRLKDDFTAGPRALPRRLARIALSDARWRGMA